MSCVLCLVRGVGFLGGHCPRLSLITVPTKIAIFYHHLCEWLLVNFLCKYFNVLTGNLPTAIPLNDFVKIVTVPLIQICHYEEFIEF